MTVLLAALLMAAAALYLGGVQAPTLAINVPLNNTLQRLEPASIDAAAEREARAAYEPRWHWWNVLRTICATAASTALLYLLVRL
jgi:uncharacterized membrane protein